MLDLLELLGLKGLTPSQDQPLQETVDMAAPSTHEETQGLGAMPAPANVESPAPSSATLPGITTTPTAISPEAAARFAADKNPGAHPEPAQTSVAQEPSMPKNPLEPTSVPSIGEEIKSPPDAQPPLSVNSTLANPQPEAPAFEFTPAAPTIKSETTEPQPTYTKEPQEPIPTAIPGMNDTNQASEASADQANLGETKPSGQISESAAPTEPTITYK